MSVREYFSGCFPKSELLFTSSGRSALQAVVEDFNLRNTSMVLPSFICSDVFSPLLLSNNIHPILVDCPKGELNITLKDVKSSYTKEVKSVLLVHTLGEFNSDIAKIAKWCKQKNLVLIEDCAHCLPIKSSLGSVGSFGSFGDASIFSLTKSLKLNSGGVYVNNRKKNKGFGKGLPN